MITKKDAQVREILIMGMFDIKCCDGLIGSIPQKFIDTKFLKCPMCGTNEPYWKLKGKSYIVSLWQMWSDSFCYNIRSFWLF